MVFALVNNLYAKNYHESRIRVIEQDIAKINDEEVLNSWYLVSTPVPALVTLVVYLGLVLYAGPRYMSSRKPYDLRAVMMVYNLLQVAFNSWMFYTIVVRTNAISYLYQHSCVPKRYEWLQYNLHLFSWCYFLSKITDLMDTVFMVLRKKQSHITFLHVYHHVSMVLFTWISVKYIQDIMPVWTNICCRTIRLFLAGILGLVLLLIIVLCLRLFSPKDEIRLQISKRRVLIFNPLNDGKSQQGAPPAILNMFVHMVMYGYYFLASLGPWIRPYLWWKRYLTKLQLGQFALVILYLANLHYNSCPVSRVFNYIWIVNVTVIATFFVNFYVQTYLKKKTEDRKKIE